MSWTVSDREFSAYSCEVLRARPLGSLAASMIGVSSIAILAAALLFARPAPVEAPQPAAANEATQPAAAPSSQASMNAEIFSPTRSGLPVAGKRGAAFDIDLAELAKEKRSYSAQQREAGGRQDTLSIGEFEGGKLFLRLDVLQAAGEKLGNSDFYLDMARHAANAGLAVTRIGQPSPLSSRFGAFEAAEIRLSQSDAAGGPVERACLAVRLLNAKLAVEVAGLACGAGAKPLDRRALGCVLDRLQYASNGDDKSLERLFSKPEPERGQGCLAAPVASAPPAATSDAGPAQKAKKRTARH